MKLRAVAVRKKAGEMKIVTIRRNGIIALAMALAMALSGCSNEPSKTPFKLDMMFLSKPKIVIAVEEKLKEQTIVGVEAFAKKVNDMSKGDMAVEVLYCENPIEQMNKRTADMAYVSTNIASSYSTIFEMLESPFYFRDYSHMTMTLNSRSFIDMVKRDISDKLKAELLATMISDASVLLCGDDYIEDINSMNKFDITLRENELDIDIFEAMGANVKLSTENEMIEDFNSGEIKNIECRISRLADIKKPLDEDFFYITESWHDMKMEWLFVSNEFMDTQSSEQKAIILDGAAALVGTLDKQKLDAYDIELDRLVVNGGEVSRYSPDSVRKKSREIITAIKTADKSSNTWNMDLYDNVQSIIR